MGVSCSCEMKDDDDNRKRPINNDQGNSNNGNNFQEITFNPYFGKNEFQIINRSSLDQAKIDAKTQGKVLLLFFGRITCGNCKQMLPIFDRLVNEKYSTKTCFIKIDMDNSPEIVWDDVTDNNRQLPWIKAYTNMSFIGIAYELDDNGLDTLIQLAINALSSNNQNDNQTIRIIPQFNQNKKGFEFLFQGSYLVIQSENDLKDAISKAEIEYKALFLNFSKEDDETSAKMALLFDKVAGKYSSQAISAICNANQYVNVLQSAYKGDISKSEFPIIQTYSNGQKFEESSGENQLLDEMLNTAIAAIVSEQPAFNYNNQVEFTFVTIENQDQFDLVLSNADSANKAFVIYFYKFGENDEMGKKFDVCGAQYSNGKCDFAKAEVNSESFFWSRMEMNPNETTFPVIQSYVKKIKINEIVGPNDDIEYLVSSAIKAL